MYLKQGGSCTFDTGWECTFITGSCCTFKTGYNCIFNILWDCIFRTGWNCTFNIHGGFEKIRTKGNSTVLIRDKEIRDYLEDEVEIYFENNEILYTEEKWNRDKYKMMRELIK